jgi:hypothetical protein
MEVGVGLFNYCGSSIVPLDLLRVLPHLFNTRSGYLYAWNPLPTTRM